MKRWSKLILVLLAVGASNVYAAITCTSITSPGFSTAFTGTVPPNNVTATSLTVTCNRNLAGDPTTLNYTIAANNGLAPTGQNNQAQFGANRLRYDAYKDAGCTSTWKSGGANKISDSMTLSGFAATVKVTNFWGCIILSQTLAAGTYTDTVTMTLDWGSGTLVNTFPVAIATPATCSITTAPATLTFSYTAFGTAKTASSLFQPTCTIYLPYTMSLSATVAVAAGLNYTLALNSSNSGGAATLASTGTGVAQTFYVNGNMAAGQAGTCAGASCSVNNTHTLTITY